MALPELKKECYTYADYLTWPDDVRYELIDGVPYLMAAPSPQHQLASVELTRQLGNFLLDKPCRLFHAPFDVRILEEKEGEGNTPEDVYTVVQPDIAVFCHPERLDDRGGKGAPDFIVEILSPSNRKHDAVRKFQLYARAGVREYWLLDPEQRAVQTFLLKDGVFFPDALAVGGGELPVTALEGCTIDLDRVFAE